MQTLLPLWTYLASIHPALPWATIPIALWLSVAAVRRWLPGVWGWLEARGPAGKLASKAWQAAPSVAGGALLAGLSGQGDYRSLVLGALAGLAAPVWHEVLATWAVVRLPIAAAAPGESALPTPSRESPTHTGVAAVPLLICLGGLLGALLGASGCAKPPAPCSPEGQIMVKRGLGAGVILAGRCDEDPLNQCPALKTAEASNQAYRLVCQGQDSTALP